MKLTYVTGLSGMDGGSIQGLNYAKEFAKCENVDLSVISNSVNLEFANDELKEVLNKAPSWEGDVLLVNGMPISWSRFKAERFTKFFGYTVFEGDSIPLDWVDAMNEEFVDGIFVPSEATKKLFEESGVIKRIEVIPHGFDQKVFNSDVDKLDIIGGKDKFKFLYVGGWGKPEGDRKAVDVLINAFAEEFGKEEDVMLVLKINKVYNPNFNIEQYVKTFDLPKHAEIRLLEDFYYDDVLAKLYNSCDCFVMPSRGESFCIPILEAMSVGLPVLVTDNFRAGYNDFCKDSAYFIDNDGEIEVPKSNEFIYDNCKWVNPSKDDLKKKMRFIFNNKELAKKTGESAMQLVQDYTWKNAVEKMVKILEE